MQHTLMAFFARLRAMAWSPAPRSAFALGVTALERNELRAALDHFAAALATADGAVECARVHNKVALVQLRRGDRPAAVAALVAALDADGRCVPAIVTTGNLLLEDNNVDDALSHYEAALRIDETYAAAHFNLGVAYKRLGRRSAAVRSFRRASRLEIGMGRRLR